MQFRLIFYFKVLMCKIQCDWFRTTGCLRSLSRSQLQQWNSCLSSNRKRRNVGRDSNLVRHAMLSSWRLSSETHPSFGAQLNKLSWPRQELTYPRRLRALISAVTVAFSRMFTSVSGTASTTVIFESDLLACSSFSAECPGRPSTVAQQRGARFASLSAIVLVSCLFI